MSALLAVIYAVSRRGIARLAAVFMAMVLIAGQLIIGERGPLIAVVAAFFVVPQKARTKIILAGIVLFLFVAALAAGLRHPNNKFSMAAVEADGRTSIMTSALRTITEDPVFGAGLGAFYQLDGTREYFHNLEGELLTETGLVGFAVFAAFVFVLYRSRSPRNASRKSPQQTATTALAVFWVIAAQLSGDIVSNSMVWISIMLWACSQFPSRAWHGESSLSCIPPTAMARIDSTDRTPPPTWSIPPQQPSI
jgi:O-antigen ligase